MSSRTPSRQHRFCIIIGAGVCGIIQGCEFLRSQTIPLEEFELLDRNEDYGGVWWRNTYPGAACDVPSQIYCISWALNPWWSRRFATQPEIQQYYKNVALDYGLNKVTIFNTEVDQATWDDNQMLWIVETTDIPTGTKTMWTCNVLISAAGQFTVPKKANITGLDVFKREAWHTVDWPKNVSLKGKRVGIIGTGPSAAQIAPRIQKEVKSLVLYQRTPAYCTPRMDYAFSNFTKRLFAIFPLLQFLYKRYITRRASIIAKRSYTPGTRWMQQAKEASYRLLDKQVKDPVVREKLRSHENFGCKRRLVLDDYYPIFNEANVELVTDPVVGLTEDGIVSKNNALNENEEKKVDVLIWGTGYRADEFGVCFPARGRNGVVLSNKYLPNCQSLYGVAIDEFPNFLTFFGPNSLSFEGAIVQQAEWQSQYMTQVVKYVFSKNKGSFRYAVVPREDIVNQWTESLREGQAKHPSNSVSCQSYYKTKDGIIYFYPYSIQSYHDFLRKPNFQKDWLLLSNRPGEKEVKFTEIEEPNSWSLGNFLWGRKKYTEVTPDTVSHPQGDAPAPAATF